MDALFGILPILVFFGVIYLFYLYTEKRSRTRIARGEAAGIHGWIALLVLSFLLLHPLIRLSTFGELQNLQKINDPMTRLPGWFVYEILVSAVTVASTALSIYAGWGLWKRRTTTVVLRAKIILWLSGPLTTILNQFVLPTLALQNSAADTGSVDGVLRSLIWAGGWTAYLYKSRLIREMYWPHSRRA